MGCVSGESESLRFCFLAGVVELVDRLGMMDNVYRRCIGSDVSNVGVSGKEENLSSCTFRKVTVFIVWKPRRFCWLKGRYDVDACLPFLFPRRNAYLPHLCRGENVGVRYPVSLRAEIADAHIDA